MNFLSELFANVGNVTWQHAVMWYIGGVLIYLAIAKKMEPALRFVFQIRGAGTEQLSKFEGGDKMDILAPLGHGSIILLNCSLFLVRTPEIPSSAKIPASCQPS